MNLNIHSALQIKRRKNAASIARDGGMSSTSIRTGALIKLYLISLSTPLARPGKLRYPHFMRSVPAPQTPSVRARALILGARWSSEPLGAELTHQGYSPVFEDEIHSKLPRLAFASGALSQLRSFLREFVELAEFDAPGGSHLIHPGVTAWAERPELVTIAGELGLAVLAPPVRVLSLFGSKLNLLLEAEKIGIPHLGIHLDPIHSAREIEKFLNQERRTLPFVLKSVRGGSGYGIQIVTSAEDITHRIPLWLEQLRSSVGEVILVVERYVEGARRIVAPFARFADGRNQVFSLVDASLSTRTRKIIEFCPAPMLDEPVLEKIISSTVRFADHCGFVGVGALEYFVDGDHVALVEGVPRLNTGYRAWERAEQTQAVEWQLAAHLGSTRIPVCRSHSNPKSEASLCALSARLYAEDPLLQLPQPGMVYELSDKRHWRMERSHSHVDWTTALKGGTSVSPDDEPLVGEILTVAPDRPALLKATLQALSEIWIAGGIQTNQRFLIELLRHPWVDRSMIHAGFVEEDFIPEVRPHGTLMVRFASVCAEIVESPIEVRGAEPSGARWVVGDQWVKAFATPVWESPPHRFKTDRGSGILGFLEGGAEAKKLRCCAYPISETKWQVRIGDWVMSVRQVKSESRPKDAAARALAVSRVLAIVPGRVDALRYKPGSRVPAHSPAVVLESLGTLIPHAFPMDVRLLEWTVDPEQRVEQGEELGKYEVIRD